MDTPPVTASPYQSPTTKLLKETVEDAGWRRLGLTRQIRVVVNILQLLLVAALIVLVCCTDWAFGTIEIVVAWLAAIGAIPALSIVALWPMRHQPWMRVLACTIDAAWVVGIAYEIATMRGINGGPREQLFQFLMALLTLPAATTLLAHFMALRLRKSSADG